MTNEDTAAQNEEVKKPRLFIGEDEPEKIQIKLKTNGPVEDYSIVQMDPSDFAYWLKFQATRVKRTKSGAPDPNTADFSMMHATLISLCLRDKDDKKLSVQSIDKWPTKLKNQLYLVCEAKNGLDAEDESGKK